jgi:hypothetical protein
MTPEAPAPAEATPSTPGAPPAALKVPLSDDAIGQWRLRLDAAEHVAEQKRDEWREYVRAYMLKRLKDRPKEATAQVPLEYAYVELKKSNLAFQVPEVNLKPMLPGLEQAVRVFNGGLNHELGEHGAHADVLIDECLTNVLLCGIAASKIGYSADIRTRDEPVMEPAPTVYGSPMPMDPSGAPPMRQKRDLWGKPLTQPVKYVASESYYWDPLPSELLLLPVEFESSDFDRAGFLAVKFQTDLETAILRYALPSTFTPSVTSPRDTLSSEQQPDRALTIKSVEGYEVWYYTRVYDPKANALEGAMRRLVFLKGKTEPVVHEDSPYQFVGEDGKLKGMKGNPIHPLTLRFLPGSAYPIGDVEAGLGSSEQESAFRSSEYRFRERSMPFVALRRDMVGPDDKKKIDSDMYTPNRVQGFNGPIDEAVKIVNLGTYPRANMEIAEHARADFNLAWTFSPQHTGQSQDGEPVTAEEVKTTSAATETRLDRERTRVLKWFTRGAGKLGALLQQFCDEPHFAEIVGEDGVKSLQAWNRQQIQGEFAYHARPDSALRIDANVARAQAAARYNLLGNDPNVNRVELLKDICKQDNLDPAKVVVEQLPEKGPEPPKFNFSFKGEDLSIINPQFPLVLALLEQNGVKFPPEAIQNAQALAQSLIGNAAAMGAQQAMAGQPDTAHGGTMTPTAPINKHQMDRDRANGGGPVM